MKKSLKRWLSVLLVAALLCGGMATANAGYVDDSDVFRVSCTVCGDTATQRGFCWYTKTDVETQIRIFDGRTDVTDTLTLADTAAEPWDGNYMHKVTVKGLTAGAVKG